ncbi:hypothetical protein [Streptomyces sp. NPDC002962]|uniref:hypothetical protein n=1 Tax=Streptomyces sp. NPDC002962 TaxID=3364674 RepID=UPI0036AE5202
MATVIEVVGTGPGPRGRRRSPTIADFFRTVVEQDSERAARRHQFLAELSGTEEAGPAVS